MRRGRGIGYRLVDLGGCNLDMNEQGRFDRSAYGRRDEEIDEHSAA